MQGVGGGVGWGMGVRLDVNVDVKFVKIQKKRGGLSGRGGGVRVDVNEQFKFSRKLKKIGGGGGQVGGGLGWWGVQDGCERIVGGRGDVGYRGCEPRIECIVQCTKRYCTIVRKLKNVGGGRGRGNI